jgi:hypothetical protein
MAGQRGEELLPATPVAPMTATRFLFMVSLLLELGS